MTLAKAFREACVAARKLICSCTAVKGYACIQQACMLKAADAGKGAIDLYVF